MSCLVRRERRRCAYALFGFLFSVVCLGSAPAISAEAFAEPVIRVEEDWQLVLNEPDSGVDSPQFHTVMSPFDNAESYFAQVLWNYRETPGFTPGGVQLQSYYGESLIRRRSMEFGQLSNTAETVTWTQTLETDGTLLNFNVTNGQSTTWGTFGKDMTISADADLADLNGYSPDTSARESCVTYGSNRVNLMVITQVRYYGESGLLGVDNTPRVVFELD
jgi:hypothetical protein